MLGVLVAFALSWLLLWLVTRKHITALGIVPTVKRLKEFTVGMIVMAIGCSINQLGKTYTKGLAYVQNSEYGFLDGLDAVYWTFKAAMLEELIFRGAILYLFIKWFGTVRACILSAIAFGIYHWFSYGLIGGRIVPMVYVFLLTGAAGWMFAYSYAKTKSILVPLGLHFGWIVMSILVFSVGPLGDQWFVLNGEDVELGGWPTLYFFLFQAVLIPGGVTWYLMEKYPDVETEESAATLTPVEETA